MFTNISHVLRLAFFSSMTSEHKSFCFAVEAMKRVEEIKQKRQARFILNRSVNRYQHLICFYRHIVMLAVHELFFVFIG